MPGAKRPGELQSRGGWSIFRPARHFGEHALPENMDLSPSSTTLQFSWPSSGKRRLLLVHEQCLRVVVSRNIFEFHRRFLLTGFQAIAILLVK
jgi:hypothetical protein